MKKKGLLFLLILIKFLSYGQESDFEKKLNKFRFSLNAELTKYYDEKIYRMSFNDQDDLIILIDEFFSKNQKEIDNYKLELLKQYENVPDFKIDMDQYIQTIPNKAELSLDEYNQNPNPSLSKLLWLNPFSEVSAYETLFVSKMKGMSALAVYGMTSQIASSLIKTKRLNDSQWEIIKNSYNIIGKFIYDLKAGKITKVEIYERKNNTN